MPAPDWSVLRSALKRPRGRLLLGLVALALAGRIALPYALRPILVAQADAALAGRIALADLDLSLIRGGVTLRGLEVHTSELPPAGDVPPAVAPDLPLPLFDAQRLWVQISWLALLRKTLRIEELELDGFHLRLERTAAGLTLPAPVPGDVETEPATAPPAEGGSGWSLAADGVRLRDGSIAFIDQTTGVPPSRFDLAVQDLSADHLELAIGPASVEPGRVVLSAQVGEGSIGLDARVETLPAGPALTSRIALSNLPLGGVQAYLPMFGWSDLQARLDAEIVHRFESSGAHEVSGQLSLSDVAVRVPDLERPALSWQKLEIALDRIDLVAQHAGIARVVLSGARVPLDLRARLPLPLLAPPSTRTAEAVTASDAPVGVSASGEPARPWTWHVSEVRVANAALELLGPGEPLPLGVDLEVRDADAARASRWPVHVALAAGDGKLDIDGTLGIAPLAFDGTLAIADLSLPELLARVPAPGAGLLRAGAARAALRIALAPRDAAASGATPTDLRVSGTLGLSGLDIGDAASAREFGATCKDFEIAVRELAVPDLLAAGGPRKLALALEKVRLAEPAFSVTRSPDGIVLPSLGGVAPDAAPVAPASPSPEIVVDIANVRIDGARARILDRSVKPAFRSRIDRVDVGASGIHWPGPRADSLVVALRGLTGAKLDVRGSVKADDSRLSIQLSALQLAQFNPYVETSGFSVSGGSLAFDSEARFALTGYDTSTGLVVSQLDVGGAQGASLFQETFGIPLTVALGLLKDLKGDIALSVPVAGDRAETRVNVRSIAAQALRKALVGALASPLKLLGAIITDGKVQTLAPEAIPFPDGSVELGPEGTARIAQLAELLAASPGISLTLTGGTSESDARILRERAILAELRASSGIRALGALGEIGTRRAVLAYLEGVHAAAAAAELDAEQRAWLDARVRQQRLDATALDALARARATAARSALGAQREIAADRLGLGSPVTDPPAAQAGVSIALGTPEVAAPQP